VQSKDNVLKTQRKKPAQPAQEVRMAQAFEACMIILFGVAWPTSIIKSYKARTAKGKSIYFLLAVEIGYLCGIISKIAAGNINYVIAFYLLNSSMVMIDILIYFRNRKLDLAKERS
jgi:hypothetical protein